MKIRKICVLLLAGAIVFGAVSCKKDKETKAKPYLSGTLAFELESYMLKSEEGIKMTPTGLEEVEGSDDLISYYWVVKTPTKTEANDTTRFANGLDKKDGDKEEGKESDGSKSYTFNEIGNYSVQCVAFMSGYNNSYCTKAVAVYEEGLEKSLTGLGISEDEKGNSIEYQGNTYYITTIGSLDWFRNNLSAATDKSGNKIGSPARQIEVLNNILGRMYSHDEAVNACPEGWRLPTNAEWNELCKTFSDVKDFDGDDFAAYPGVARHLMGDCSLNGDKFWTYWPEVGDIMNTSKLAMFPCGYAQLGEQDENGTYPDATSLEGAKRAVFWTADKTGDGSMAYYKYLTADNNALYTGSQSSRHFGANVRCVREHVSE
ncbi:MAG: FISUMP domain-containing protein [Candidatus Cryptobacteroides sp.]